MASLVLPASLLAATTVVTGCKTTSSTPKLPGVGDTMQQMIDKKEIAGSVTLVVSRDKILHEETTGFANIADKKPMAPDSIFWIASMTKPVTGTALLMLQDQGKLNVSDPVAKYIPEFANLKTPSGQPANLTIRQIMTHTSGLGEGAGTNLQAAKTLADMIPVFLAAPMQYEPGSQWKYTQSGINTGARIVEVASGMTFDAFLQKNLFDPLGMKSTGFYPTAEQQARIATGYAKNRETGELSPAPPRPVSGPKDRPPQGNGGLFSTGPDYARFCQMLLNGGTFEGHRYLSPEAMKFMTTKQTGDLPTGFIQKYRANYAWGIGTCLLLTPHEGVAEVLSPGSFGHGGAWGTQAWVDPVKGVAYIMMVQRSNFPNSDESDVRREFQKAAAKALAK